MSLGALLAYMAAAVVAGLIIALLVLGYAAMRRSGQLARIEERQLARERQAAAIREDQRIAEEAEVAAFKAARTVADNDDAVTVLRKHRLLRSTGERLESSTADMLGAGTGVPDLGAGRPTRNRIKQD